MAARTEGDYSENSAVPLPVLEGDYPLSDKPHPPNSVSNAIAAGWLGAIGPLFIAGLSMMGDREPGAKTDPGFIPWAILWFVFWLVSIPVNACLVAALGRRSRFAWRIQPIVSLFGLLVVPLGTLMHLFILLDWWKPKTKAWFGIEDS